MSKRTNLLRSILSFNYNILKKTLPHHENFSPLIKTITSLTKRVKRSHGKKHPEIEQLGFVTTFTARFKKHRRKTIIKRAIDAIDKRNARKIIYDTYGKKTKILTLK